MWFCIFLCSLDWRSHVKQLFRPHLLSLMMSFILKISCKLHSSSQIQPPNYAFNVIRHYHRHCGQLPHYPSIVFLFCFILFFLPIVAQMLFSFNMLNLVSSISTKAIKSKSDFVLCDDKCLQGAKIRKITTPSSSSSSMRLCGWISLAFVRFAAGVLQSNFFYREHRINYQ